MAQLDSKKQAVFDRIDQFQDEMVQLASDLVKFPSLYQKEEEVQKFVAQRLENMGANVDLWYPDIEQMRKHPAFASTRESFDTSPNVCGVFKGTGEGRSLIINGHVDVVPVGQESDWDESPWSGTVKDGRIYGRGIGDMKAGIACSMIALQAIKAAGLSLKGDVLFQTVVDEECGGMGSLAQLLRGYRADAALFPECMRNMIGVATVGSTWVRITVPGKGALLSNAETGASAIEKAFYIYQRLDVLEKDRTQRLAHPLLAGFKTPFKINVGKLNGGNWPSAVPDQAVMEIRYGMSPMETVEQAKAEFEDYINRIADADPWLKDHHPVVEWLGCCWHPYSMDTDDAFVQIVAANHEAVVGNDATICGIAVAADAALYSRFLEIPSILFGPGEVTVAHQANEYVEINKMMDATKVIAATIMDWCGYQDAE